MLYPLKFTSQLKERVWGGTRLRDLLGKEFPNHNKVYGESWELSGVQDNISVVSNGLLAGNTIQELIEVYMWDLVGEKIYQKFGIEFPLLIKLIDTSEFLSIQVHPNDELAKERHHAYGKTEMWYVLDSSPESKIITGFNSQLTREDYKKIVGEGNLSKHLKAETTKPHDFYYIPSGSIHSLGKDLLLVEIQQTSDLTYRIYDWDRKSEKGEQRELHTDLAIDAINFESEPIESQQVDFVENSPQELISCPYFTTNRLIIKGAKINRDLYQVDSFVVYVCIEGEVIIECDKSEDVIIKKGELVLIPAEFNIIGLVPKPSAIVIEVYVE